MTVRPAVVAGGSRHESNCACVTAAAQAGQPSQPPARQIRSCRVVSGTDTETLRAQLRDVDRRPVGILNRDGKPDLVDASRAVSSSSAISVIE